MLCSFLSSYGVIHQLSSQFQLRNITLLCTEIFEKTECFQFGRMLFRWHADPFPKKQNTKYFSRLLNCCGMMLQRVKHEEYVCQIKF